MTQVYRATRGLKTFSYEDARDLVNEGQRDIAREFRIPRTAIDLTTPITLADVSILAVAHKRDNRYYPIPVSNDHDSIYNDPLRLQEGSTPRYAFYSGGDLSFIPDVAGVYRVEYASLPPDLDDDADEPFNGNYAPYHAVLPHYAASRLLAEAGDQRAEIEAGRYAAVKEQLRRSLPLHARPVNTGFVPYRRGYR